MLHHRVSRSAAARGPLVPYSPLAPEHLTPERAMVLYRVPFRPVGILKPSRSHQSKVIVRFDPGKLPARHHDSSLYTNELNFGVSIIEALPRPSFLQLWQCLSYFLDSDLRSLFLLAGTKSRAVARVAPAPARGRGRARGGRQIVAGARRGGRAAKPPIPRTSVPRHWYDWPLRLR